MPDPIVHLNQPVIAGLTGNLHTDDHTSINDNCGAVRRCKSVYIFTPGTGLRAWYSARIRTAARA